MDIITPEMQLAFFAEENRKKYFEETLQSLTALLDDAYGDDQNGIRTEFPAGCERNDIKIENTKVALTYFNEASEPYIEVLIQISYKGAALGEYQSIYNIIGELEDESFFFE